MYTYTYIQDHHRRLLAEPRDVPLHHPGRLPADDDPRCIIYIYIYMHMYVYIYIYIYIYTHGNIIGIFRVPLFRCPLTISFCFIV